MENKEKTILGFTPKVFSVISIIYDKEKEEIMLYLLQKDNTLRCLRKEQVEGVLTVGMNSVEIHMMEILLGLETTFVLHATGG